MGNKDRSGCIAPDAGGGAVSDGTGVRGFRRRSDMNVNVTVSTVDIMFYKLVLLCVSFGVVNGVSIGLDGHGTVGTGNVASGRRTGRGRLKRIPKRIFTTVSVTVRRFRDSMRSIRSAVLAVAHMGHDCSP